MKRRSGFSITLAMLCLVCSVHTACHQSSSNQNQSQNANAQSPAPEEKTESPKPAFEPFWNEFQKAVRENDKAKLYSLTKHSKFRWGLGHLRLKPIGPFSHYSFRSEEDFRRVHHQIFPEFIKKKILSSTPESELGAGYSIYWNEGPRRGTYTILIDEIDGEYKYGGMLMGPGY